MFPHNPLPLNCGTVRMFSRRVTYQWRSAMMKFDLARNGASTYGPDLPHGVDDADLTLTRDLLQQEIHRTEQPAPLCRVPVVVNQL